MNVNQLCYNYGVAKVTLSHNSQLAIVGMVDPIVKPERVFKAYLRQCQDHV